MKSIIPKRGGCRGAVNTNKSLPRISLYMNSARWIRPDDMFKLLGPATNRNKHFSSDLNINIS